MTRWSAWLTATLVGLLTASEADSFWSGILAFLALLGAVYLLGQMGWRPRSR